MHKVLSSVLDTRTGTNCLLLALYLLIYIYQRSLVCWLHLFCGGHGPVPASWKQVQTPILALIVYHITRCSLSVGVRDRIEDTRPISKRLENPQLILLNLHHTFSALLMAPQSSIPVAATVLGTIGTVLWCIQLLPQIWTNWRSKATDGMPASMMFLWALCAVPFGVYSIVQNFNIP